MTSVPTPISEYAVLGDGFSAALVSRRGSIDWLCLPNFDSPACFAALLGNPGNGRWLLTVADATEVTRKYVGDSFVLETTYVSPTGTARITDAMPSGDGRSDVIRRIEVLEGSVTIEHEWIVRFNYGRDEPWVRRISNMNLGDDKIHGPAPGNSGHRPGSEALLAIAGPDSLLLRGDRIPVASKHATHKHVDRFTTEAGSVHDFVASWSPSWEPVPDPLPVTERLRSTTSRWQDWSDAITYRGPHPAAVNRSLLVLRLLTHTRTGGIVAAATTSLPEDFGGTRNWDYRFSWLRDAAMTVEALCEAGYDDEVWRWRDWLLRAVAGKPSEVQIMYGVDGRRDLPETNLDHLSGYADSRPVRIGNAAVHQMQNDVLGEVMCALDLARRSGTKDSAASWAMQRHLVDDLLTKWHKPDHGIWEVRGDRQHFVHSRVMCWAAFDRAVRAVEEFGQHGHVEQWRAARDEIHAEVLEQGWNDDVGSFVQFYGAQHTDASLLQMFQVGFLPPEDPRMRATVRRIQAELGTTGGLIRRYLTEETPDGVEGEEHPFLVCCFWLVDALARMGEIDEAETLFNTLVGTMNDVGLMAEQFDYDGTRMAGNFPQAFSHLGLVRAAHSLERARVTDAMLRQPHTWEDHKESSKPE